jgi:hypothetical protein
MADDCGQPKTKVDGFTVATPGLLKSSLAQKLVPVADKIRDLYTVFGARPYRIRLVRTRWVGGRRGVGVETVIYTMEIVPTPKVIDLNTLSEMVTPVGTSEIGLVQLQQVSGRYTEDMLLGVDADGNHVGEADDLYYEIEFFRRDGQESIKRRFALATAPYYHATKFQWNITLDSQVEKRRRDGRPRP